jgi:hypothetical protein
MRSPTRKFAYGPVVLSRTNTGEESGRGAMLKTCKLPGSWFQKQDWNLRCGGKEGTGQLAGYRCSMGGGKDTLDLFKELL